MGSPGRRWLVMHPSDEMYGADRILLAAIDLLPGDVRVWLPDDVDYPDRPLSRELARRGIPVEIRPLPVARRARLRPAMVPTLARELADARRALRAARPDRVLLSTSAVLPLAPAARSSGAVTLLHLHEIWGRTDRAVLTAPALAVDRIIAVSDASRAALPGPLRRRATTVRNGVPAPDGLPAGAREQLRASIDCPEDALLVVVASRWNAWKGARVLIDAWARLRRPDLHLAVLGGPPLSGAAVDVPSLVSALPAGAPPVSIVGSVPDPAAWLAAADVVVVPSERPDPFPTIALEAMAAGRAVVASDIGGLPEMVTDGVTGRLVTPGDPGALAGALAGLTREQAAGWGERGHAEWARRFTPERFRADLETALT